MKIRPPMFSLAIALVLAARSAAFAEEPSVMECLAAYERAIPLRNEHKLNAARAWLLRCAASSCPQDVRVECAKRVDDLGSRMPTLVFEVRDEQGSDLSAVSVSMDGALLAARTDGKAFELDPGEHEFAFSAQGREVVSKRLVIHEGEKDRREKIVLPPIAKPDPAPPPPKPLSPEPEPAASNPDRTRQIAGIVVSAIGVATLGVALYEQVTAHNRYAASEQAARSTDPGQRASTHSLYQQAKHAQTSAIVIAVVGAAVLVPGAYLLLSGSLESAPPKRPEVGFGFSTHGGAVTYTRDF